MPETTKKQKLSPTAPTAVASLSDVWATYKMTPDQRALWEARHEIAKLKEANAKLKEANAKLKEAGDKMVEGAMKLKEFWENAI